MPLIRSSALAAWLSVCLVTAALYLGKPFLMPLALSILLAFLLAPPVGWLEARGFGRTMSVALVAALAFSILALAMYLVGSQAVDLAQALPSYRENLQKKVFTPLDKLTSAFSAYARGGQPGGQPPAANESVPQELAASRLNIVAIAQQLAGPLLSPLGTAAIVILYVIFFLIDRQSLRDRFIHLVARGHLHLATQAIDEAATRVSRYLAMELLINASYGIPVGIGLAFIGIPNAALWGVLAILLRFLPYLGVWIAAAFPVVLSFAVFPGWTQPLETIGLLAGMEIITANFIEPWLYGASTGLTRSGIIVSAIFWSWVWGAGGLLLATPLTACLVVLGKHLPPLAFLEILFGEEPPIAPQNRFYQRWLAEDGDELEQTIEDYHQRGATLELFEEVILPAMQLAERDRAAGNLSREEQKALYDQLHEALTNLDGFPEAEETAIHPVVIVAARTEADALAGAMLAWLLRSQGIECTCFSERMLTSEVVSLLAGQGEAAVCLSALTRSGARTASSIFKRIGQSVAGPKLLGLWHRNHVASDVARAQPGIEVITSFGEAIRVIRATRPEAAPAA